MLRWGVDFLRSIHSSSIALGILFPAFLFLIQTVWSLYFVVRPASSVRAFLTYNRLLSVLVGIITLSGVALSLMGLKTPIATPGVKPGDSMVCGTLACQPLDPSRNWEHWMYTAFIVLSLVFVEVLLSGRLVERKVGARFLGIAAFFAFGAAIMVMRVVFLPGSTPGT